MVPSNNNLIEIATIDMQGEKHKNFFTGLGSADKVSNNNVENTIGRINASKNIINPWFLYNNMKNIVINSFFDTTKLIMNFLFY